MTATQSRLPSDWEAAHAFLEVARQRGFRAAAGKMRQSVNVLRRKVDELEARMGFALLLRRSDGVVLTEEGHKVYRAALEMEKASFGLLKAQADAAGQDEGEVIVAATEGLGSVWLTSKLPDFHRANPGLVLNLSCTTRVADVMRLEADIAVRLARPKPSELKITKLARLHVTFYAHRSYLEAHGTPTSLADLSRHHVILQYDAQHRWVVSERYFFPTGMPKLGLRTNAGSINGASIINGAGIGLLPTYVEAVRNDMVALDLVAPFGVDVWITYRGDAQKIPRVQRTIEWLTQAFDPRLHPWFRDEFIHPRKFARAQKSGLAVMQRASRRGQEG